ncbi:MAG TPA: nucleoside-diphosphate sugar epimerase/dehydratase [Gammaproteobacteria bacterium]
MSKFRNRWVIFGHDLLWVPLAITLAYSIRFNLGWIPEPLQQMYFVFLAFAIPVHAVSFWLFGCYRGVWRFASIPDLLRIVWAVCLGLFVTLLCLFVTYRLAEIPRSVMLLYPLLLAGGVGGVRIMYRAFRDHGLRPTLEQRKRALIVGAGRAGEMLVRDLRRPGTFYPLVLLDDDPAKQGQELHGVRVRGPIGVLPEIVRSMAIDVVLIAIPSAGRDVMDRIVDLCTEANVEFRTLPSIEELADGRAEASRLRPVTVEDLLGRDQNALDNAVIDQLVVDSCVMITGGGGSIGSELCRQVASHGPRRLVVVDNSEFNLYRVEMELFAQFPQIEIHAVIGDIRNAALIENLFGRFKPSLVFHAAAYKHVPILEENPCQGVENNVLGTKIVADAAVRHAAERFVFISTDKTVNPTSVMGATKRVAELYCQNLGRTCGTQFVTTRFGNVLASCGSVVPLFEEQIRKGGPVTVTDPEVTRYFMTIQEAVGLILQAAVIGKGGEILVMDMGQPIRIRELAEKMIRLAGKTPGKDIQLTYTGLRPGEKLHEELFYAREELLPTSHPKLMQASSFAADLAGIEAGIEVLHQAVQAGDPRAAVDCLRGLVPEFHAQPADWAVQTRPSHLRIVR